jgi:tRNA pseudouridine55 synthase
VSSAEGQFHGLLIVDKPGLPFHFAGNLGDNDIAQPHSSHSDRLLTSHDIVQRVRRLSGQRRIGHTGTLDPFASGVLVLCLGQATRLVEYYQGHDKHYLAEVVLGTATDTYDSTGAVTAQSSVPSLTTAMLEQALDNFRGSIMQTPPAYSALKQDGESLHAKARRGEEITLVARPITFYAIRLLTVRPPNRLWIEVHSSSGAYIRSLAYDIGRVLGCHAHLGQLRRTATGPFEIEQAHTLDEIASASQRAAFCDLLLPAGVGLKMPTLPIDSDTARRLGFGQIVAIARTHSHNPEPHTLTAAQQLETAILAQGITPDGKFVGIVRKVGATEGDVNADLWKAEKWFAE